jgi:hypothetical protein
MDFQSIVVELIIRRCIMKTVTVYCPRGCNIIDVDINDPWDECANCGSRMTPHSEKSYYSVHQYIEDCQMAEFESREM